MIRWLTLVTYLLAPLRAPGFGQVAEFEVPRILQAGPVPVPLVDRLPPGSALVLAATLRLEQLPGVREASAERVGGLRLGAYFDLRGQAYLLVRAEDWAEPVFYKLEAGMSGSWESGGARYFLELDVSLFRRKTDNYIVIRKEGESRPFYRGRIQELLLKSYESGQAVTVGTRTYRLFYACDVDASSLPARLSCATPAVALIWGSRDWSGAPAFDSGIFTASELSAQWAYAELGGQRLALRIVSNVLEIYELKGS